MPTDLGLCGCGMAAVGRCVDCDRPLCWIDLVRRDGRVLCADDARARTIAAEQKARAADTDALEDLLDRIAQEARGCPDPTERAFVLALAKGRIPPTALGGHQARAEHQKLARDMLLSVLTEPSPAFAFSPQLNWVEVASAPALAAWAFDHPRAPKPESLRVVTIIQYLERFKIPRGRVQALRLSDEQYEAPTGDFRVGTTVPPTYLLRTGVVVARYRNFIESKQLDSPAGGVGVPELARVLGYR